MEQFISRIDHLVITFRNIEATINFSNEVLGMKVITFGENIVAGPVIRTGATGAIESIYLHDIDGNLFEIANYRNT